MLRTTPVYFWCYNFPPGFSPPTLHHFTKTFQAAVPLKPTSTSKPQVFFTRYWWNMVFLVVFMHFSVTEYVRHRATAFISLSFLCVQLTVFLSVVILTPFLAFYDTILHSTVIFRNTYITVFHNVFKNNIFQSLSILSVMYQWRSSLQNFKWSFNNVTIYWRYCTTKYQLFPLSKWTFWPTQYLEVIDF